MPATLMLPDGSSWTMIDGACIGRSDGCALQLLDRSVSREHAVVRDAAGRWTIEDLGSRNGTRINDTRLAIGHLCPLRHGDRISVGGVTLVVSAPEDATDTERTSSMEIAAPRGGSPLSAYQLEVVRRLAEPWLVSGDEPASNEEIADALGTPMAVDAVKAALRRAYAKAGLADAPMRGKRRALCRVARERGWV